MRSFESHKHNNDEERRLTLLKKKLLDGQLSLEKFRKILLERDQSSLLRDASLENLKLLTDPEIVQFLDEHLESREEYYRFLSLTEVHVAQVLFQREKSEKAFSHFEQAFLHAKKAKMDDGWIAYLEGILTYLQGKEIPKDILERVTEPRNKEILIHFNEGLKKRGRPSYLEDYNR